MTGFIEEALGPEGLKQIEFKLPQERGVLIVRVRQGLTDKDMVEVMQLFQAAIAAKQGGILVTDKVEGIDLLPAPPQEEETNG